MEFKSYLNLKGIAITGLFLLLGIVSGFAQRTITGTINGTDGPIIGASIVVKGTTNGAVTDENGNFSLTTKESNPTLVVSALSYQTQEIVVDNQSAYNLSMKEDVSQLNEVVVSGYYNETKRQTTGSVSTVRSKDLTAVPSSNVEQQLQGKVSGVTVIASGQPGSTSIVRIHGFGSFGYNNSNNPLYVVDGVATSNVDFLNPDDIETTTVLKDAAAASVYGVRASAGVIVFTTKHAKKTERKLAVTYDAVYGVTTPGQGQAILNPQEQADWKWAALKNAGEVPKSAQYGSGATPVLPDYINVGGAAGVIGTVDLAAAKLKYSTDPANTWQVVKANKAGTDWYGAITRNAPLLRQNLGFSGGTENMSYYVALGMQNQSGILLNNDFTRYNLRVNTDFNVFKGFRIGENLQFTYISTNGLIGGNGGVSASGEENDILQAFRMAPIIPVYDEFGGWAGTAAKEFNNPRNPVANRDGLKNNVGYSTNVFGNVYAELDVLPGLTLRTSLGGRHYDVAYNGTNRAQYENSENNTTFSAYEGAQHGTDWVLTNTANYKKTFGAHAFDVLVGQEALENGAGRALQGGGISPYSTDPNYVDLNTVGPTGKTVGSAIFTPISYSSYFGRLSYGFNDKYYLAAVVRRDASSTFGANNRVGIFPAFSAAWRVTGEDFLKNSTWLSDLKLRAGWGKMANDKALTGFNQYSTFGSDLGASSYDITGSKTSATAGFYRTTIGNPDARWETATTTNIAADATLFKGKIEVSVDLWQKITDDLLFPLQLQAVVGNSAANPFVNIASMSNKGIDFQVINRGKIAKDWSYEANLTGSFLQNKITSIAPGINYFDINATNGRISGNNIRNQVGLPISSYYGYQVQSIFQTQAEVDAAPKQDGAGVGRFRFVDTNGDGKITPDDRTNLGSPVPAFTGGLNLKLTFKDVTLETYLYTSLGNKLYNLSKWYTDFYPSFPGAAISARVKTDTWTPTNTGATTPIFEDKGNLSTNQESNSFYVEDGSFLRMQNISLSYQLPQSLIKGLVRKAKIYASVNNIFTITKYKGLDPGVGGAADYNFGVDVGNYPLTRSYTFGVNIGF